MKNVLTIFLIIIALGVLWYLVSPLWRVTELDEPLPGAQIGDNLYNMDTKTTEEFNTAMLEANETPPKAMNEGLPNAPLALLAKGAFTARAHNVEGTAALVKVGEKKILRFENFSTINGPDLHIYLASDLSVKDYVDLGPIRATKGNVNYNVNDTVDTAKYRYVLVWCEPFKILFSYAELK